VSGVSECALAGDCSLGCLSDSVLIVGWSCGWCCNWFVKLDSVVAMMVAFWCIIDWIAALIFVVMVV